MKHVRELNTLSSIEKVQIHLVAYLWLLPESCEQNFSGGGGTEYRLPLSTAPKNPQFQTWCLRKWQSIPQPIPKNWGPGPPLSRQS